MESSAKNQPTTAAPAGISNLISRFFKALLNPAFL